MRVLNASNTGNGKLRERGMIRCLLSMEDAKRVIDAGLFTYV